MAGYINWMALTQPRNNGVLQMEGNAVSDGVTVASGGTATAPNNAQYASVWSTVATKIKATNIGYDGTANATFEDKEYIAPANTVVQIPNIIGGKTVITVTDV